MPGIRIGELLATTLLCACGEEVASTISPPPPPPARSIVVDVVTTGIPPDSNGYLLNLDGVEYRVGANDHRVFTDLTPDTHTVRLSELSVNCRIHVGATTSAPAPQDETWDQTRVVEATASTLERFDVRCYELGTLDLVIKTITGGWTYEVTMSRDPRSFTVSPDRVTRLQNVAEGSHVVFVSGLCGFDPVRSRDTVWVRPHEVVSDTLRSPPCRVP
jgi:hypothetical protein